MRSSLRLVPLATLIALVAVLAGIERLATPCGASWFQPALPYDLRAHWMKAVFWITDAEGWGVVAPPSVIDLPEGRVLHVKQIQRYTLGPELIVEVRLESGDLAWISFAGSTVGTLKKSVVELTPEQVQRLQWVDKVDPGCFYWKFVAWRVAAVAIAGVAVAIALRAGRTLD
jgi:hypothetical protein